VTVRRGAAAPGLKSDEGAMREGVGLRRLFTQSQGSTA
jgi:hypothetical protein